MNRDIASHSGLWAALLVILPFLWMNFIEPRIAIAEELQEVVYDVSNQIREYKGTTLAIQVDLIEMRIELYEDRIRGLESKGRVIELTQIEYLRLNQYEDRVSELKRKLERLGV